MREKISPTRDQDTAIFTSHDTHLTLYVSHVEGDFHIGRNSSKDSFVRVTISQLYLDNASLCVGVCVSVCMCVCVQVGENVPSLSFPLLPLYIYPLPSFSLLRTLYQENFEKTF